VISLWTSNASPLAWTCMCSTDHPLFDVEVGRPIIRTSKRTSVSARNPGMVGEAHVNQRFGPRRVQALLRKVLAFDFFGRLTRPEIGRIHQFGIDELRMRNRPGMTVSVRRPIFSRQMVGRDPRLTPTGQGAHPRLVKTHFASALRFWPQHGKKNRPGRSTRAHPREVLVES